MHNTNKTLEKGYKYTRPTFHYTHSFKRTSKILETNFWVKTLFVYEPVSKRYGLYFLIFFAKNKLKSFISLKLNTLFLIFYVI